MSARTTLPNRRLTETFDFTVRSPVTGASTRYILSVGYFDGTRRVAEIFVNTDIKHGSDSDTNASDAAVAVSLALQHGCPLRVIREAMKRNGDGTAQGPIGAALDKLLAEGVE